MCSSTVLRLRAITFLLGITALLGTNTGLAAPVTLTFSGNLNTVNSAATAGTGAPILGNVSGGAYTGSIAYDSTSGVISSGQLTFTSGYSINNHNNPPVPEVAWTEWSWTAVTYELAGTMMTNGNDLSLLIGNELDISVHTMSSAEVLSVVGSTLIPATSGSAPSCTAYLPSRQGINCDFATPADVLGLDSLSLSVSLDDNTHLLGMDDFIQHCGLDCDTQMYSTEWHHLDGSGYASITLVPVPAAAWLFGSALLGLSWMRRRA